MKYLLILIISFNCLAQWQAKVTLKSTGEVLNVARKETMQDINEWKKDNEKSFSRKGPYNIEVSNITNIKLEEEQKKQRIKRIKDKFKNKIKDSNAVWSVEDIKELAEVLSE